MKRINSKITYDIHGEIFTCLKCGLTKQRNRSKDMQGFMELGQFSLLEMAKFCPICGAALIEIEKQEMEA